MATAAQGMNPAYLLDPSLYGDQQAISQQQALAQALLSQGLSPMGDTQMAGQVALRNSPTQSIAKIAQLLSGQNIQQQANTANQALMQRQSAAMLPMFGMGQPQGPSSGEAAMGMGATQGSVGPTVANAQLQNSMAPPQPQQGPLSLNGESPMANLISYGTDPAAHMKALADQFADTPEMKQAAAAYGRNTPAYFQALQAVVQKAGYRPPVRMAPGGGVMNADGSITTMPSSPPMGYQNMPNGDGTYRTIQTGGGLAAVQNEAQAKGLGKAGATPSIAYDDKGTPIFSTQLQDIARSQGWSPPTSPGIVRDTPASIAEQIRQVQSNGGQPINPADQPAIDREVARLQQRLAAAQSPGAVTPTQRPGVVAGAEAQSTNAQNTMNASYKTVMGANAPTATVMARLDNIGELAKKAITGGDTEWRDYANNLLQLSGISQRAVDRKTAGDLLDKNAAQIALQIGTGAQGTDGLRALAAAANPGRHMTPGAIDEAVQQLKASAMAQQAKAQYLTPLYSKGEPGAYNAAEQAFDKNADYRVWQLQSMTSQQAQALRQRMGEPAWQRLLANAKALKGMGAL